MGGRGQTSARCNLLARPLCRNAKMPPRARKKKEKKTAAESRTTVSRHATPLHAACPSLCLRCTVLHSIVTSARVGSDRTVPDCSATADARSLQHCSIATASAAVRHCWQYPRLALRSLSSIAFEVRLTVDGASLLWLIVLRSFAFAGATKSLRLLSCGVEVS